LLPPPPSPPGKESLPKNFETLGKKKQGERKSNDRDEEREREKKSFCEPPIAMDLMIEEEEKGI
jgi:hypothetical protein